MMFTRRQASALVAGSLFSTVLPWRPALAVPAISARDGVAIQGFDAVSYFADNRDVKGSIETLYRWRGALWLFSNAANRDLFAAAPEKYCPQYGGYCALSVAYGKTAPGVGDAWHIHEGKLYLNYDKGVRDRWRRDVPGNIARANLHWPKLVDAE